MKHPERIEQMKLVALLDEFLPDLLYWHTPNGEERYGAIAVALKRMGVKPGVPDLFFPTMRLFVEMKAPNGLLSEDQLYVKGLLELVGYRVDVYTSARAAFDDIERRARAER